MSAKRDTIFDKLNEKKLHYRMPGEFEKHRGCVMIWPVRPGSWPYQAKEAQSTFSEIARAIAVSEKLWMLCGEEQLEEVKKAFAAEDNIYPLVIATDDAWARDVGPTCVYDENGQLYGVDWCFNAWGGEVDGLYASWDMDDAAAAKICEALGLPYISARPFVLEGGSIHSDGEGTVIVTEACLLSEGRNPELSKADIEQILKKYLGAEKIIWLPFGIYNDETNEHVDNVCAFARPGEVILAWTENENNPQYSMSLADYDVLCSETDAKGRSFIIHKLPIPDVPVCITKEELEGFSFEEGEDERKEGERLAASYVNFYISNDGIIMPVFGNGNEESDKRAADLLAEIFPERKIYQIYARPVIVGGGNIHCITQQIPL